MEGVRIGYGVFYDGQNLRHSDRFEIFLTVRTKEYFFVECVVDFVVVMIFDIWHGLFVVFLEPFD